MTTASSRLRLGGAALPLIAAGVTGTLAADGGRGRPAAGSEEAFGQHYDGLQQRRRSAGVATMSAPTGDEHIHAKLAVWADGKRVAVPRDIGIDPRRPAGTWPRCIPTPATARSTTRARRNAKLGEFFAVWGVPFGADRLGFYRAGASKTIQLWVDGRPSEAWSSLALADGQQLVVAYGSRRSGPPEGPRG